MNSTPLYMYNIPEPIQNLYLLFVLHDAREAIVEASFTNGGVRQGGAKILVLGGYLDIG